MPSLKYVDRVKQTSTTTGTGAKVFSGSVAGFQDFADDADLLAGHPFPYEVHAVDAGGLPTGEWETGVGYLNGSGHLVSIAVTESSNAGAAVAFSAGAKVISLCIPASLTAGMRRANVTYYVRKDGSDANSGLVNTASGAFLTIQHALDVAAVDMVIIGSSNVSIFVDTGSYSEYLVLPPIARSGSGRPLLCGNGALSTDVTIRSISAEHCGAWILNYFSLENVDSVPNYRALDVGSGAFVELGQINFAAAGSGHQIFVHDGGSVIASNYRVSGGGKSHVRAEAGGTYNFSGGDIMFTASVTYSDAVFNSVYGLAHIDIENAVFDVSSHSATVTGKRYDINGNAVCYTAGAGASFIPGTVAGSTATGGQYL